MNANSPFALISVHARFQFFTKSVNNNFYYNR